MKAVSVSFLMTRAAPAATCGESPAGAGFPGPRYLGDGHHGGRGFCHRNDHARPYARFPSPCYSYALWYP